MQGGDSPNHRFNGGYIFVYTKGFLIETAPTDIPTDAATSFNNKSKKTIAPSVSLLTV